MLKITKVAPDRIDIELRGSIDSVEMATGLDRLVAEAADMKNAKMLYQISDFAMPSLSALAVEFGRLPTMFGLLNSFDRCAVLCDTDWLRNAAEFEGFVLPGIEIKSFPFDARDAAEDWLEGETDPFESVPL